MQVAASVAVAAAAVVAVAAVAAVDDEDGVQWWRWGGRSMVMAAFDGSVDGLWIGDVEAKMAIDTISGVTFPFRHLGVLLQGQTRFQNSLGCFC